VFERQKGFNRTDNILSGRFSLITIHNDSATKPKSFKAKQNLFFLVFVFFFFSLPGASAPDVYVRASTLS